MLHDSNHFHISGLELLPKILLIIFSLNLDDKSWLDMASCFSLASDLIFCNFCGEDTSLWKYNKSKNEVISTSWAIWARLCF